MNPKAFIYRQTAIVALGQLIGDGIMFGVFALLHKLGADVFLGALIGSAVAIANFFIMAVSANLAADKAEAQDVKGGKALIQRSYLLRFVAMALLFFVAAKSGYCNVFALVLPVVFVRPTVTLGSFFQKE